MGNLKISIVTICYNAVESIEKTILSVVNQTYDNIEYIIVDGASFDGTKDVIKKYENKITCWISEPDKGIYDAMNKGIKFATGDYINFMNAGDSFYSYEVISEIVPQIKEDSSIVYGDTMCIYAKGKKHIKPLPVENISNRLFFNHQSSFADTKCMKNLLFDLSYKLCADYKFHYDLYMKGYKFQYIPQIIANYDAQNGISSKQIPVMMKEYGRIQGKSESIQWKLTFHVKVLFFYIKKYIKLLVPETILMRKNGIQ